MIPIDSNLFSVHLRTKLDKLNCFPSHPWPVLQSSRVLTLIIGISRPSLQSRSQTGTWHCGKVGGVAQICFDPFFYRCALGQPLCIGQKYSSKIYSVIFTQEFYGIFLFMFLNILSGIAGQQCCPTNFSLNIKH